MLRSKLPIIGGRMNYLDDLDNNIAKAEELVEELIKARNEGWDTVYDLCDSSLRVLLKSIKHCINCANKKWAKRGYSGEFKCSGGCIRAGAFDNFSERNKNLHYILRWSQKWRNHAQMPGKGM